MPRGPKGDRRADVIGRPLPLRRRALPSERSGTANPEQSRLQGYRPFGRSRATSARLTGDMTKDS
jgi:hypothetical protein